MAHFLICSDHAYSKLPGYRSELLNEAAAIALELQTANLTETKICLKEKLFYLTFEHLCGPNKLWNFREMLKFVIDVTRNEPEPWKTIKSIVNILLEGEKLEFFLSFIQPFCPQATNHCKIGDRRKRNIPSKGFDGFDAIDFVMDGGHVKGRIRKRAFDPLEMMGLFNKIVCNQEMIVTLAEYYENNYTTLTYSRIWPIKNISLFWCCLAENLEELYRITLNK